MQKSEKILEKIKCALKEIYLDLSNNYSVSDLGHDSDKVACVASKFRCLASNRIEEIIRKHMNDDWIPVEKYGLPKNEGVYDLTIINGNGTYDTVRWQFLGGTHLSGKQHYVDGVHYWVDNYRGDPVNKFLSERVIAWRRKPEPYRPDKDN